MGETSDGQAATGPGLPDDGDPDSPAKSSFFSRLFRRDDPEDDDPLREPTPENRDAIAGARDLLINLRNMRRLRVDDVSVPRADIVAVSEHATLDGDGRGLPVEHAVAAAGLFRDARPAASASCTSRISR